MTQVGGCAIGFLSVTTNVDADLLSSCYQLEPFHGLKRPVEEDEIQSVSTIGERDSIIGHVLVIFGHVLVHIIVSKYIPYLDIVQVVSKFQVLL